MITITLYDGLTLGSVLLLALFFPLRFVLAIWGHLWFHINEKKLFFFSIQWDESTWRRIKISKPKWKHNWPLNIMRVRGPDASNSRKSAYNFTVSPTYLRFQIHGVKSAVDCIVSVVLYRYYIQWKNPLIRGPMQFKPVLFKGQ